MALRDQPYLPLYVQDYLTDEKLNLCSASSQGIYIKILCIMHKSDEYGCVLLRQKDKQSTKQTDKQKPSKLLEFATKLAKLLPFEKSELSEAIEELVDEGVLQLSGDVLSQKRMIKDAALSIKRSEAGRKGGEANTKASGQAKHQAKHQANTEYESESDNVSSFNKKDIPKKEDFVAYGLEIAARNKIVVSETSISMKYDSWVVNGWKNGNDKPIKSWKQSLINTIPHLPKTKKEEAAPEVIDVPWKKPTK